MFEKFSIEYVSQRDGKEMSTVPTAELDAVREFARLAKAAGPAQCNHPADSLDPFDLIVDAVVCGECGAVLKNYGPREAAALGIEPGWTKLCAAMLEAEIHKALRPAFDLLSYIETETSRYGDCHDAMDWSECVEHNDVTKKLERVR